MEQGYLSLWSASLELWPRMVAGLGHILVLSEGGLDLLGRRDVRRW